jgi:hypothetical protein
VIFIIVLFFAWCYSPSHHVRSFKATFTIQRVPQCHVTVPNLTPCSRKIRALIDNNEMKVGEFQKAINVTSTSYSRFMGQNGPYKGSGSDVYWSAWAFFKKRELRGIKSTPNKKAKAAATDRKDAVPSVDEIVLEGEMDDDVPVFGTFTTHLQASNRASTDPNPDTCDDIRRKINAHLKKPGVTQAALLRSIAAQYHTEPKKLQSSQLGFFRSKKGAYAGNTSSIFYGAYVYFEKLRIKEGKPKGKKRLEMEETHGGMGGLNTERLMNRFFCRPDERPGIDSMGRIHFYKT